VIVVLPAVALFAPFILVFVLLRAFVLTLRVPSSEKLSIWVLFIRQVVKSLLSIRNWVIAPLGDETLRGRAAANKTKSTINLKKDQSFKFLASHLMPANAALAIGLSPAAAVLPVLPEIKGRGLISWTLSGLARKVVGLVALAALAGSVWLGSNLASFPLAAGVAVSGKIAMPQDNQIIGRFIDVSGTATGPVDDYSFWLLARASGDDLIYVVDGPLLLDSSGSWSATDIPIGSAEPQEKGIVYKIYLVAVPADDTAIFSDAKPQNEGLRKLPFRAKVVDTVTVRR
jgi:hypothetical protein